MRKQMPEAARIADQLQRVYDGDAWYGPSVRAALEGVDASMARARPLPAGHTIGELVLHMTAWTREVTRRLRTGIALDPEEGDWPLPPELSEVAWRNIIAAFDTANEELVDAIAALDDAQLRSVIDDVRPGASPGMSRYITLHGLVQHHAYHAGQISLLKKVAG